MDEGLLFLLIIPTFVIILPIVASFIILNFILRNKKSSIVGAIIGFIGMIIIGYVLKVFWYVLKIINHSGISSQLFPFMILILSITLTTFIGLVIGKELEKSYNYYIQSSRYKIKVTNE